ncbi:hypothetical protein P7K49_002085 [Saguinus oedipus]|uniref:Uncharacterized protein n=1 Tax=Saguinus oedipus TaxID=9490 RepID=A0ABQ9WIB0_SAGOE|nr:hypothetical protein P7K49_002085 [Saguinus oedipus]
MRRRLPSSFPAQRKNERSAAAIPSLLTSLNEKRLGERATVTKATSRGGPGASGRAGGEGRGQAVRRWTDPGGGRGYGPGRMAEGRGQTGGNSRRRRGKTGGGRGERTRRGRTDAGEGGDKGGGTEMRLKGTDTGEPGTRPGR